MTVLLRDCLRPDTLLVLVPGSPGAAGDFAAALGDVVVAETSWSPWQADGDAFSEVGPVPLATVPAGAASDVSSRLAPLFATARAPSTLWSALHAPDVVLRTAPTLLLGTVGPTTLGAAIDDPAVAPVLAALDEERAAVASALGLSVPRLAPALADLLGTPSDSLSTAVGALADGPLGGDVDLIPYGLVPTLALAQLAGVTTPVTASLIDVADKLLGNDFVLAGRSEIRVDLPVRP
ncbi:hypothetical protein [Tsukamurella soli]|uniref:hypothetical protein n=1 Tax=Tsukamurella soli TaxID=644556 RepID=UPI00360C6B7B